MSSVHLHTVSDHASLLLLNLNAMRKKHHLCDVVLRVQGKHFPAHKAVLAGCSQWFYCKFVDQMSPRLNLTGSAQPTIVSLNELTLKGFQPILEFAYTSRIRLTSSNVFDILSAASYLQMHKLMADCTSFMRSHVEVKFREPLGGNGRGSDTEVTSNFSPPHAGSPLVSTYETSGTLSEQRLRGERNDRTSGSPQGALNVSEGGGRQADDDRESQNIHADESGNSSPHSNLSSTDKQSTSQSSGDNTDTPQQSVTVKIEKNEEEQPACSQADGGQQNSVTNSEMVSSESSELEHRFSNGGKAEHGIDKDNSSDPSFLGSAVYPVSLHAVGSLWPDQSQTGAGDSGTESTAAQDPGTESHDVMDQMATLQQQARNSFLEFQEQERDGSTISPHFPQGLEAGDGSNLRHLLTSQDLTSSGPSVVRDILTAQAASTAGMSAGPTVGRDAWFHSPEMVAGMGLEGVMGSLSPPAVANRMIVPNPNRSLQPYREKRVTCSICKSQFNMIGHLKQHLLQVHSHCPKVYLCDTCGAQFDDVLKLTNHMATHNGRFSCQHCGKRCSQLSSLYAHERTHTGERPYHCQSCGKSFRNKSHLNRHRLIHTGVKMYQCNLCMKKFTRREGLKLHMPRHAGEYPYLCHICLKAFSQQDLFTWHKAQHNGRKNNTEIGMNE